MPLYRYRANAPGSACEIECGKGFEVRQELSEDPIKTCPLCGSGVRRVIQAVATVVRHNMKGTMHDYRDDLARFPGDKEAYVDGPRSLQKLMDKRKREGWTFGKIADAAPTTPKFRSSEEIVREAYKRAEAKGFTPDDD